MGPVERQRLKEMAVDAMTGHLETYGEDPLYVLGKALEEAIEDLEDCVEQIK